MRVHVLETQLIIYTHICEMLSLDYHRISFLTRASSLCWIKKRVEINREPNDGKQKWVIPIHIGISTYIFWLHVWPLSNSTTPQCHLSAQWQGWVSNDVFPCLDAFHKGVKFETCVHWIFYSMVLVVNQASKYIDIYIYISELSFLGSCMISEHMCKLVGQNVIQHKPTRWTWTLQQPMSLNISIIFLIWLKANINHITQTFT